MAGARRSVSRCVVAVALCLVLAVGVFGRTGAWVDEVVFFEEPSVDKAIEMLGAGEMDLYARGISPLRDPELLALIERNPDLTYDLVYDVYYTIDFNPCGPVFPGTCKLNPFAVPRIREAVNWLIDRERMVQETWLGFAVPRYFAISPLFPEYARLAALAQELEGEYRHDFSRAMTVIQEEMELLGAVLVDGRWYWPRCCERKPVELTLLLPTWAGSWDLRRKSGEYVAELLEALGFLINRQYFTSSAARGDILFRSDPCQGLWHINVQSWVTSSVVPREERRNFATFYTPLVIPFAPWTAYRPLPGLALVAGRLNERDFQTLAERQELMATALKLSMKDSITIWLAQEASVWPRRGEISVATGIVGGLYGSWLWPHTLRFVDAVGGTVRIGVPDLLIQPWNPLDGSDYVYDLMIIRATGDMGTLPDPFTGLHMPSRIERGEVTLQTGLVAQATSDWITLDFQDVIEVPADAWVDWDPVRQVFITVGEKYPEGLTAKRKSVAVYPADFLATVKWHDGSPISVADLVLTMILAFDRGMEESAIYDPSKVADYRAFTSHFRGFRITSMDPLTVEYYSDEYTLDAENMVASLFPYYAHGPGAWHTLALGIHAEADKVLAFSKEKSETLGVDWMNYAYGPSLPILREHLDMCKAANYIPYAPTLGQYITEAEAAERWANLAAWHSRTGHFWVGTGPFYLKAVDEANKTVHLARFEDYPDLADK